MDINKGKKRFTRSELVHKLGLVSLCKWITRKDIKIVTVHGVIDAEQAPWNPLRWQLGTDDLRNYLEILVQEYEFITPSEAIEMYLGQTPRRKNCAIFTIDDGYLNSLTQAMPVLAEFDIKPFIFVVTDMVGENSIFWFDRLDVALQSARGKVEFVSLGSRKIVLDPSTHASYSSSCKDILRTSREVFDSDADRANAVEEVIAELYEAAGEDEVVTNDIRNVVGVLSRDELMQCVESGAEIGSHTVNHVRLPFVSEEEVRDELRESKATLEKWLGRECKTFCYPEGAMTPEIAALVREAGYRVAFAVSAEGRLFNGDVMNLHRVHLPPVASEAELLSLACGLSELVHGIKNRVANLVKQGLALVFKRSDLVSGR